MNNNQNLNNLDDQAYVSLSTKKRDGSWVNTPVWFAKDGGTLYCFSASNAGKVKRLRNFSEVKLNPCTVNGKLLGDWQEALGEILPKEAESNAHKALVKKYGWQMRLLDFFSCLSGKIKKRAFIKITLTDD
jgi:PPOX class probable F420-dependent enzyme